MTQDEIVAALAVLGGWAVQEHREWSGDIDGGGVQDKMQELGLLVEVPVTSENVATVHELCEDVEVGDRCLHYPDGVLVALKTLAPKSKEGCET